MKNLYFLNFMGISNIFYSKLILNRIYTITHSEKKTQNNSCLLRYESLISIACICIINYFSKLLSKLASYHDIYFKIFY